MSLANVFEISAMGMSAQSIRLNTTASNMANANTSASSEAEAYRAKKPVFKATQAGSFDRLSLSHKTAPQFGVIIEKIVDSQAPINKVYAPNDPQANEEGYVFRSNVNTIEEMADMISASRAFQMNAEVMNTTKSMMQRLLTLGK